MKVEVVGKVRDFKVKKVRDLFVNLLVGVIFSRKDFIIFLNVKFNYVKFKKRFCVLD